MTISLPIGRRATKCFVPGASAIYLFNEGAGTVLYDHSGNGHHGTLGAGAAAPTWGATGLTFDGGDAVALADWWPASAGGAQLTVQVATTNLNNVLEAGLISQYDASADRRGWGIFTVEGRTRFAFSDNGTAAAGHLHVVQPTVSNVTDAVPSFYTFVFNAGSIAIYKGTTAYTIETVSGAPGPTTINHPATEIKVGAYNGSNSLIAAVHAITLYPTALTPAQVAQNYTTMTALLAPRGVTLA